jgi:hypothetical protein
LQHFPENADMLQVARGNATLIKKDIFKNLMWYVLPDSNKQYPLTIERVKKIKSLNHQNIIPEEMEAVDVTSMKQKEVEPAFVDLVGHISLQSLEKADKKRHQRQQSDQRQIGQPQQRRQQPQQKGGVQKGNNPQQKINPEIKPGQVQKKQHPSQQRRRPPSGNNNPKKDQ